ncbi:hypothetical protein GHT09_002169 [Marmota monax]|nr:hypothetical protein GHT09_002169 [Marmota monax]
MVRWPIIIKLIKSMAKFNFESILLQS